jgi:hypothetical protein
MANNILSDSAEDWTNTIFQSLQDRNKIQVEPFTAIYQSNAKLWYEHARLQSLLKDVKHQLAIVQHETVELLSTTGANTSVTPLVEKLKLKLAQIQSELREKGNLESNEQKMRTDLSKKNRDQGKLISDQLEELKVAKTELSSAHEKTAYLTEEIRIENNSSTAVNQELENIRKLFHNLELENAQLIERIIAEKDKTAQAMNDMMARGEGR